MKRLPRGALARVRLEDLPIRCAGLAATVRLDTFQRVRQECSILHVNAVPNGCEERSSDLTGACALSNAQGRRRFRRPLARANNPLMTASDWCSYARVSREPTLPWNQ